MKKQTTKPQRITFAAIDPFIVDNSVDSTEYKITGQEWFAWGRRNGYPKYLFDLYRHVPTLKAIIDGTVDYVCGESVSSDSVVLSDKKLAELVRSIAKQYVIYGGFALNVLRNRNGEICRVDCLDWRNVRTNEDCDQFYYSKDFSTKTIGRCKVAKYPAFDESDKHQASSVYYYKDDDYAVYPTPLYNAAITACEIEKSIDQYHLNQINNQFMSNYIINFNNGDIDDEQKEEIERNISEKFCGKENAGRPMLAFNEDKEHQVEVVHIQSEDYADRYESLAKRSQQAIFTAFRATPALFGIPTENNGFAAEQYQDQYALFYASVVRPIQKLVVSTLSELYGTDIIIEPFKIEFEAKTTKTSDVENEN